jgi:hypothetical protein
VQLRELFKGVLRTYGNQQAGAPQPIERQRIGNQIDAAMILCGRT